MKRIVLKSLAITLSAISLLNISPIKTSADPGSTLKNVLKGVTIACAISSTYYGSYRVTNFAIKNSDCITTTRSNTLRELRESYQIEFQNHTEPIVFTKRQEGVSWCWLACLQALLKDRKIEKTQVQLYKEITGKDPGWFECTRKNGLVFFENLEIAKKNQRGYAYDDNHIYLDQIRKYIDQSTNGNYEFKVEYFDMDMDTKVDDVCAKIKNIYKNNENHPFSIIDSRAQILHMVNIIKIDNNDNVVVECPGTEIRRTEPLKNFVERYRFPTLKNIINKYKLPGLAIYYLSSKN